jgi:hypothetical protein
MVQYIKKNLLLIFVLPLLVNFVINLSENNNLTTFYSENLIYLFSLIFSSYFFFLFLKYINSAFEVNSYSLSLCYILSGAFLFEFLLLPFKDSLKNNISLIIFLLLLIGLATLKMRSISTFFHLLFSYLTMVFFNNNFYDRLANISNYIEWSSDVPAQWLEISSRIHERGLFQVYYDNPIRGQGLFISYTQSLIFKINFPLQEFEFSRISTNLLILFSVLIFFDLKIMFKNKIFLSLGFVVYVLNSGWLTYLIFDSLMLEGLISFIFAVYLYHSYRYMSIKFSSRSIVFFVLFSALFESKEFLSTLGFIYILYLFFWKRNVNTVASLVIFGIQHLYSKRFVYASSESPYLDGRGPLDLIFDILTFQNIDLSIISKIISKFYLDKVTTYIFICFILISFIRIKCLNQGIENRITAIVVLNIVFIFILYTNWWKNIEIESSFRYFINSIYLIFIVIGLKIDKLTKL